MDLTDILFSKPFIGSGGGGGGGNVETATIVISVADGTPEITSGELPDWCTADNSQQIIGTVEIDGILAGKQPQDPTSEEIECRAGITEIAIAPDVGTVISAAYSKTVGTTLGVVECVPSIATQVLKMAATDMSSPSISIGTIITGTITINLIYMPEE